MSDTPPNDKPSPGKFEGNESLSLAEFLYDLTLEGDYAESCGDVDKSGWFAIVYNVDTPFTRTTIKEKYRREPKLANHYILEEDPNGFFRYWPYDTQKAANKAWETIKRTFGGT